MPDLGPARPSTRAADPSLDGFVEITRDMGGAIEVRYATPHNFLGRDIYQGFVRLHLHRIAADKLHRAVALLQRDRPGWRLLLFDGLRPNRIQRLMWAAVRGTPQQSYVADPAIGSIHGYGLAIDLSLQDDTGHEVDMGTAFDAFTPLSEPRREADFLASGDLTGAQIANRHLLRRVMTEAGFHVLPVEWWHFDALPPAEVRARFRLVE